jgi:DNA repair protein RecO (recombination protein O)
MMMGNSRASGRRPMGRGSSSMQVYSADALVLRTYRYGEADRIVVFLTEDRGKKRGVARNASASRRRFGAALEPLTQGRATNVEREHRELVRLDRVEPRRTSLGSAEGRPAGDGARALGHAGYFAELIDEWAPDASPNARLYRLGVAVADALAEAGSIDALARYFEYWLLRLHGVYPDARPALSPGADAFLSAARLLPPHRVGEAPADRRALDELQSMHRALIAMHLEKTLKSDRVLRDLRRHDLA